MTSTQQQFSSAPPASVATGSGGCEASSRLFTSRAVGRMGDVLVAAFAAAVTRDPATLAGIVVERTGIGGRDVRVEEGFDEFDPFSLAMVPEALREELVRARSTPASPTYRGYSVLIERRFVA